MASTLTLDYFWAVVGREDDPEEIRDAEVLDLLKGAENKILAYTSRNGDPAYGVWVDAICSVVQLDMVKRAYKNPDFVASDAMGGQARAFPAPGGLFLLPGEREELDKLKRRTRNGGLGIISTHRPDYANWANYPDIG